MNIVENLRRKIQSLEEGDHLLGLKAVLRHIETAFAHLTRGQEVGDDSAFTDAIYRANQAFEGSIKEAYRVLAGQDPSKKSPFEIESYLEQEKIVRSRVLALLTNYRTQWRNPSTHDYKLDFDEGEAFVAAVSVTAFATLLLSQIAERLAFNKAETETKFEEGGDAATSEVDLQQRVVSLISAFCESPHFAPANNALSESQSIGALHGFLSATAPDLVVLAEVALGASTRSRADLLIKRGSETVVVELKRRFTPSNFKNGLAQVSTYLSQIGEHDGVLLFLPQQPGKLEVMNYLVEDMHIVALAPQGAGLEDAQIP